jgi:hypothetical protein
VEFVSGVREWSSLVVFLFFIKKANSNVIKMFQRLIESTKIFYT